MNVEIGLRVELEQPDEDLSDDTGASRTELEAVLLQLGFFQDVVEEWGGIDEGRIDWLQLDPESYLNVQPNWVPTVPTHDGMPQSFRVIDFLTFAGVDPISRGQ